MLHADKNYGKGRTIDNIWIERFWKSIKYNYIYLNLADDGLELYEGVQDQIAYYNNKTHHTTKQTPNVRLLESNKNPSLMNENLTANLNLTTWPFGVENGEYYARRIDR